MTRTLAVYLVLGAAALATEEHAVKLTPLEDRIRIEIGGRLFSEYRFRGAPKPCLFPILDADGISYTRDWPMKDNPAEVHDHNWHRSVWFGHGLVNGHDFWREIPERKTGRIVHEAILGHRDGPTGLIRVRNRWEADDGEVICTDETSIGIQQIPQGYVLDFAITLKASHGDVTFGDTEEGSMAVRVNEATRVAPDKTQKDLPHVPGHIINANGDRDVPAWGKRAAWCDYHGEVEGRKIGVAIFDHPMNPTHPTWWHVRPYGLFAANPFGKHDFEGLKDQPEAGSIKIPAGSELVLRYRILFHRGDEVEARVADLYREYAAGQ